MTGADRVNPEAVFERTDRVETLAGVIGEEAPKTQERLDERLERLPLRGRLLFDKTGVEATENGTPEANCSR